MAQLTYYFLCV